LEWQLVVLLVIGSLLIMMATGLPVAFCFMLVNIVGVFLFWGGQIGLEQLIVSASGSVTVFSLLPIPLFVLMGEVMFHSGLAPNMMDSLEKWLGHLPGRLSILAVGSGTLLASLSGSSLGTTALLGTLLVPEMEKRGYQKLMSLGPIMASGGLAIMIPPSALAVLLGALGEISIGKLLIAIILPGLLLATLYAMYIIVTCKLIPSMAPYYEVTHFTLPQKLIATARYILPLGFIFFMVVGLIFLGVATPTEAAATGAIGCFILAASYRRLNWEMIRKSVSGALNITVMILMVIVGAKAFSQILAYTGVTGGIANIVVTLPVAPILVIIIMQGVLLFLGMFMDAISMMMVTVPIFIPIVHLLGFDPVWFAVLFLINIEVAALTPPFGMHLYVMKGVAPSDTTMGDIIQAVLPFIGLNLIAMALIICFPVIGLWLPGIML
jgi:tripartite ATP-independent transporter DctM subunit